MIVIIKRMAFLCLSLMAMQIVAQTQSYTGCSISLDASMNLTATCSAPASTVHGKVNPVSLIVPAASSATVGQPFSMTLSAIGGIEPYNFAITDGALPAGLSLSSAGVISGTPSGVAPGKTQSFTFTVTVTDKNGGTTSAAFKSD